MSKITIDFETGRPTLDLKVEGDANGLELLEVLHSVAAQLLKQMNQPLDTDLPKKIQGV